MINLAPVIRTTFYVALAAFLIFFILFVVHYTVYPILSFSPGDGGWIPIPTVSDSQSTFKNEVAPLDASANLVNLLPCSYTVSMDVYLTGEFQAGSAPRPLLYRTTGNTALPSPLDTSSSNLIANYERNSNFILWLDPIKNDLFVSTILKGEGGSVVESRSPPLENLPLRKPFRLTAVFTQRFVELYLNGRLRLTHIFTGGEPIQIMTGALFGPKDTTAQIANLQYWPNPISPAQVEANGRPLAKESLFTTPAR